MRKFLFWVTVASGVTAAFLMFRRGASLGTIASETLVHPVSSLATEIHNTLSPERA